MKSAYVHPSTIVVSPDTVATATSTAAELKLPASRKTPESYDWSPTFEMANLM